MACAYANLVLGTNHTPRFLAAHLALLDYELLVAVVELSTYGSNDDLLASSNIGSTAHDLYGFLAIAQVNGGDVQVVAIRMVDASENLANYEAAKATAYCFNLLESTHFEAE